MKTAPASFTNATVTAKANVYFDGKVVSHTVLLADGTRKTIGLIYPGTYHFGTQAPERMEIIAGDCRFKLDGAAAAQPCGAGQAFEAPGNSGFAIEVSSGICEYICTFLPSL